MNDWSEVSLYTCITRKVTKLVLFKRKGICNNCMKSNENLKD